MRMVKVVIERLGDFEVLYAFRFYRARAWASSASSEECESTFHTQTGKGCMTDIEKQPPTGRSENRAAPVTSPSQARPVAASLPLPRIAFPGSHLLCMGHISMKTRHLCISKLK